MQTGKRISSVQLLSRIWVFAATWNAARQGTPGFPVHNQLLELAQTHGHRIGDTINHLMLCHPLTLLPSIFPSIRVFSKESVLRIMWPKYWSFSFSWKKESSNTWRRGNSVLGNFCDAWQRGDYRHRCDSL